ncbi:Protein ANTAGONIST OF LIKE HETEROCHROMATIN PROTEIN 1 [Frankliniella fusca]|uniref:Protein ANTAGONIST OF LIKE HETEROCHROMATIN PROTEIN 1 n=1 Tax=Frankliniella fusca TaxID=407009 RepID=A0AAE1HPB8_9NEOP|nr:Protein ANTAGONIST OF LIKE HETEROCHROMATIN PROTEIN 1 [Frankliniella fusca]
MSVTNFQALFEFLGGDNKIKMLKLEYYQKTPQRIRSVRKLSFEDKLFMFLLRLRRGYPIVDLAHVFGISKENCSKLLYSMLRYLYIKFEALSKHMFISAEAQKYKKPKPCKPFKNLRVIIDGLELKLECPSNFQQQGNTYSHYKSDNTVRFIVGISCYGGIMFITPGFEGNMTENQALKESGFYDLLQFGDVVMCDRGFEINDELLRSGVEVLKPPSLGGRKKFTAEEEVLTRAIASARIYVEHAVRLIKANRLLRFTVPMTMIPKISDYVYVAGFLANFGTKSFQCKYKRKND